MQSISLDLKNYRGVIFHDTKESKFGGKLTYGLKNDIKNLAHFNQNKIQNWDSDGFLLSKVENA